MPPFSIRAAIVAASVGLAGCALDTDYSGRYTRKGDVRPHPGVASAKSLPVHGIDVSRYQAEIDWKDVKEAGTRFVFIKATEGGDYVDPNFRRNWEGARRAGIPRGAYHFVYWCRPAHEQAVWFRQHIPADADALPPVLDVEWNGHSRTCPRKVPVADAREKIQLMLTELEQLTGKKPIIYTDITFHQEVLEGQFNDYPYWIRSTAAKPEERYNDRRWAFWQYTTTGRVPGIAGDVDRNAFFGTDEQFQLWLAGNFDIGTRQYGNPARQPASPQPVPAGPPPQSPAVVAAVPAAPPAPAAEQAAE